MIISPEEFIKLRTSHLKKDQDRASHDRADNSVWIDTIKQFPEFKIWVIHNKTIPIDILEILAADIDSKVREAVALKRKINNKIFNLLSCDKDENVRCALLCNTKLSKDMKKQVKIEGSAWLKQVLNEQLSKVD
jgi:hypothetical protein